MLSGQSLEVLTSFQVFPCDNIHGVSISGRLFCCFGNRSFRAGIIVSRQNRFTLRLFPKTHRTSDWILQTRILPRGSVLLLTMHNFLVEFDLRTSACIERRCEMRSVSYSGRIYGDSKKNLCVISGTAKGCVLIWLPYEGDVKVAHVLHAHRGAVFDVAFCAKRRLLCSTSDDRSCSMWRIHFQNMPNENKLPTVADWRQANLVNLFVVYGHSARVWRAEFSILGVVSTGEDGLVILWSDQGDITWAKHVSRTSLRALYVNDEASYVLVGADSGSIIRLPLWPTITTYKFNLKHSKDYSHESIVGVHLLSSKPLSFLCASNFGNVFIHDASGDRLIVSDQNLKLFVSCKSVNDGLVAFGGLNGAFYLLYNGMLNDCSYATAAAKKIFSLHLVDSKNKFLLCAENGRMLLLDCSSKKSAILYCQELLLPDGRQRWSSAAILVPLNDNKEKLIVGDRNGSVHFYALENGLNLPEQTYSHLHGRHGVTDFCVVNGLLCSVGRNSMLCLWKEEPSTGSFKLLSKEKLRKGLDWPDRFVISKQGLQLAGFHGDKFLTYDFQLQDAVFEICCGGGHRNGVRILAQGAHCRRINDVCFLKSSFDKNMLIATCSDDNAIMLWRIDNQLTLLQRLLGHVSAVLCLHGERDFIFSGGGRAELLVWHCRAGRFCLVNRIKDSSDYRYTSLDCQSLSSAEAHWLIVAARSDAVIIAYQMMIDRDGLTKLNLAFQWPSVSYVFDAKLIRLGKVAAVYAVVCSDGNLYAKNIAVEAMETVSKCWDFKYEIHSHALTALCPVSYDVCGSLEGLTFAIGTESGEVYLKKLNNDSLQVKRLEPSFASSVTSIKCTSDGLLVAISAEDRLHIWQCRPDLPCCYGELLIATLLDISDPLSLCVAVVDSKLDVIVCGQGVQYIRLELNNLLCNRCFKTMCLPR
ncbi:WD repeat-containing protein 6 [Trichuris trichiura]|uniref:tRNA (34-2'-O)-methyltransferase regulator WDR6 n=1 Tax=Trichuris trichiura TaxID=36087 RepID=A0A077YZW0_TRITR|nr:WD repeat-containing protein 6 [Trichuris trichiura]